MTSSSMRGSGIPLTSTITLTTVLLVIAIFTCDCDATGSYKYLGCYADTNVRDLNGKDLSFSTLSLDVCAAQCVASGFPFLGLQSGSRCFCGSTFGAYGPSTGCNITCGSFYCGGYMANDVYYTVDNSVADDRILKTYDTPLTFDNARSQCIQSGGDIAIMDTSSSRDSLLAALSSLGTPGILTWVGLYHYPLSGKLEWTDENVRPYSDHPSDYSSYWAPGEPKLSSACVAVNTTTKLLQTMLCSTTLPFACKQLTPQPTTTETTYPTAPASSSDISEKSKRLALYIVLPIFFFCYGGSCIIYCAYKIYKNCCRSSNQHSKMVLDKTIMYPRPNQPVGPPPVPLFTQPFGKPKYINGEAANKSRPFGGMGMMGGGKQEASYPGEAEKGVHGFVNPVYASGPEANAMGRKMAQGVDAAAAQKGEAENLIDLKPVNDVTSYKHPPTLEDLRNESRARKLESAVQQARDRRVEKDLRGADGDQVKPPTGSDAGLSRPRNGSGIGKGSDGDDSGRNSNTESIASILLKKVNK